MSNAQRDYQQEKIKKAEQLVYDLSDAVNGSRIDGETFADRITTREHRTLQQLIFGMIWRCIVKWAEHDKNGWYDARNEATVKLCRRIVDAVGEEQHFPYI